MTSSLTHLAGSIIILALGVASSSGETGLLRYDGFYCLKELEPPYTCFLRFYADGAVMATTSTGTPEQVSQWLHRGNRTPPIPDHGRYVLRGQRIRFTISGWESHSACEGEVWRDTIFLQCNGKRRKYRFDFLPLHLPR
jgi:hypothetical protein